MSAEAPALELRGITKRFGPVVANDGIDFDLRPGEVHALLGENGAGKSTLMSILYGLYSPDEGEIRVNGEPVEVDSPSRAIELGIGMVHQHFMLVPVMTVTENIVLGERAAAPRRAARRAGGRASREGAVRPLRPGRGPRRRDRGRVGGHASSAWRSSRRSTATPASSILDEPTAVLTAQETSRAVRGPARAEEGRRVDRLHQPQADEVLEISDRVTVLRRGKQIDTVSDRGGHRAEPRPPDGRQRRAAAGGQGGDQAGRAVLEVEDLHVRDERGLEAVKGVSLTVRGGEMVALAGVDGNGQLELVEAIAGVRKPESGRSPSAGRTSRASACASRPTRAWRTSPRTASCAGSCSTSRLPRTLPCASTARLRSRGTAGCHCAR